MRHLLILCAASVSIGSLGSAPALAQTADSAPQAKKLDPNEVICEKEEDTGSRLSAHKICMTRGQWAEQRRVSREDMDKVQTQRACNGQGSGSC